MSATTGFYVCLHGGRALGELPDYGAALALAEAKSAATGARVNVYPREPGGLGTRLASYQNGERWPVDA
jgi:hypothetical protein